MLKYMMTSIDTRQRKSDYGSVSASLFSNIKLNLVALTEGLPVDDSNNQLFCSLLTIDFPMCYDFRNNLVNIYHNLLSCSYLKLGSDIMHDKLRKSGNYL